MCDIILYRRCPKMVVSKVYFFRTIAGGCMVLAVACFMVALVWDTKPVLTGTCAIVATLSTLGGLIAYICMINAEKQRNNS